MHDRERRLSKDDAIRVFHGKEGHRAVVVNVSSGGACLSGVTGLPEGAQVIIRCEDLCLRAEAAWSRGLLMGVRFTPSLNPAQLEALQRHVWRK